MKTILDEIIAGVRESTAVRRADVRLEELQQRIVSVPPALDVVGLLRETSESHPAIIAEIKRKSPSKGYLGTIRDPAALARIYEAGGASAISVLTEERRFGGSIADLDAVRQAVKIPILRKDFMVEEYQFYEARAHGTDLVLLIVAALEKSQLRDFFDLTHCLGMTALVETHTMEEMDQALELGAELIGVNVRNLKTLAIDKSRFMPLSIYAARQTSTWKKKPLLVGESGVSSVTDVEHYRHAGADAILVGEALVKTPDPATMIREFTFTGFESNERREHH